MEQNNQDRYKMVIGESHVTTDDAFVAADVKAILDKHFDENNNVEVYISFLRKKLRALHSEVQIKSIRNAGYHLEVQP